MEPNLEQEQDINLQPANKTLRFLVMGGLALVVLFVVSLIVSPLLHPDHRVTKIGIITNVATSGDPYFNATIYTLTFQDGDVLQINAQNSIPFPVGKPIAVTYSARGKELLDLQLVPASDLPPPAVPVHK